MDFPGNTRRQRAWFKQLADEVSAPVTLMFLDVSDEQCLERIAQRAIEQPERAATDTARMFHQVTRYFEPPGDDEGFEMIRD